MSIYFTSSETNCYTCNICQVTVVAEDNVPSLAMHMQEFHKDVCELHKANPSETVGFRIEFLQLDPGETGGEVEASSGMGSIIVEAAGAALDHKDYTKQPKTVGGATKKNKHRDSDNRRRSWVWKYFDKLSSIIFKCNICNVVLSIKGCNTNNMNRHVKSKHPALYHAEMENTIKKRYTNEEPMTDVGSEVEIPGGLGEEPPAAWRTADDIADRTTPRSRTSWVWNYFTPVSKTLAQCKLCRRSINHGGNATGNMNRHLKKLHEEIHDTFAPVSEQNVTAELVDKDSGVSWIWKLFADEEGKFYECRLCGFKCMKFSDRLKSVSVILQHLSSQHEVVSGDQIVTAAECEQEQEQELAECSVAVDFLKDAEDV